MPLVRRHLARLAICVAAAAVGLVAGSTTPAGAWSRPARATVKPSMMLYTKGAQCTANFVYVDRAGRAYIGQAAHCSSRGAQTDTNGCKTRSWPLGTVIRDGSGRRIGTLAYNSWIAMQRAHEKRRNACAANDLALVRIDRALVRRTTHQRPVDSHESEVVGGAGVAALFVRALHRDPRVVGKRADPAAGTVADDSAERP